MALLVRVLVLGAALVMGAACDALPPGDEKIVLGDTRWTATSIAGRPPVGNAWIEFDDGALAGSSGCNTFSADYSASEQALKIGSIAGTKRFCPSDALMAQEQRFLDILSAAATVGMKDDRLVITGQAGRLVLERAEDPVRQD